MEILRLLGLIYRAKKLVLGEEILKQIKKVRLIIIASDISALSRERFLKKCEYYKIGYIDSFSGAELSGALGKANVKAIGIIDEGFAKTLLEKNR